MKISHRLIAGNIIIIVLVVVIGIFGLLSGHKIVNSFESAEKHFRSIITAATEVSSYAKRVEGHLMLFLTLQDSTDRGKFYERYASLNEEIKVLDLAVEVPEARAYVEKIKTGRDRLLSKGEELLALYDREMARSGRFSPSALEADLRAFNDIASDVRQLGVDLAVAEAVMSENAHRSALRKAAYFQMFGFAIILGGVITALIQGYIYSRKIARPLVELDRHVAQIANGNLEIEMAHESRDEIGELTASFNLMTRSLRESRQELLEEKERLLVTLGSIGDGVITTDIEGRVLLMNRVAEELTGWKQEAALSRNLLEVFPLLTETTREPAGSAIESVIETGCSATPPAHVILTGRDGSEKLIARSATPIIDSSGQLIGAVLGKAESGAGASEGTEYRISRPACGRHRP